MLVDLEDFEKVNFLKFTDDVEKLKNMDYGRLVDKRLEEFMRDQ
jgi:hypothetical protein